MPHYSKWPENIYCTKCFFTKPASPNVKITPQMIEALACIVKIKIDIIFAPQNTKRPNTTNPVKSPTAGVKISEA